MCLSNLLNWILSTVDSFSLSRLRRSSLTFQEPSLLPQFQAQFAIPTIEKCTCIAVFLLDITLLFPAPFWIMPKETSCFGSSPVEESHSGASTGKGKSEQKNPVIDNLCAMLPSQHFCCMVWMMHSYTAPGGAWTVRMLGMFWEMSLGMLLYTRFWACFAHTQ